MAQKFLKFENIDHDEKYSHENILAQIEKMRENPARAKEAAELENLYTKYPEQLCALFHVKDRAIVDEDEGEKLSMSFNELEYHRPEIETEKGDSILPSTQLELICTFEDGTSFGLSALPATPISADKDEPAQLRGEVRFPEDTLKTLNEEKFKRIMDFCHTYGFSTFGLSVPTYGGEIDVDEKIAELLTKYQEQQKELESHSSPKPSEDENSDEGFRKEDFHTLVDEEEDTAENIPETENAEELPSEEKAPVPPAAKKRMDLDTMVNNIRLFIENDLQKRYKLSYWEHIRTIDGRKTHVFSIYDKENSKNWSEDGCKDKDGNYVSKASCRLAVSQSKSGKFFFGYSTPNGAPMKDSLASDFLGEVKKAGITHINFTNLPKVDKMTWMVACAENGIIPTGLSFSKSKIETMLQKAQAKLSTEEYASFIECLMDQWEEETAKKGKTLAVSDQEFIRKCRNDAVSKREDQYGLLEKAEFEKKFKNFKDAYGASDGLLATVNELVSDGGKEAKSGGLTALAAVGTLARTFDIVLGTAKDKNGVLDVSLGDRLKELVDNPRTSRESGRVLKIRLTEEERRALAPLSAKNIKDLTKNDYITIFNVLYKRQLKETRQDIIDTIKADKRSSTHVAPHLLIEQKKWNSYMADLREVNEVLSGIGSGVAALKLPEKHAGLPVDEFIVIAEKEVAAEKAAAEAAKSAGKAMPKPTPERSREAR